MAAFAPLLARVALAVLGGYALASALVVLLAALLARMPAMPRAEAVLAASLLGFGIYAAAVVWLFAVHSLHRAVAVVAVGTVLATAAGLWLGRGLS